jgi:antitoxin YokJ
MSEIVALINKVRAMPDCEVLPAAGLPDVFADYPCPDDLREFYTESSGVSLFRDRNFGFHVAHKNLLVRSNPFILGAIFEKYGQEMDATNSRHWYIIASGFGPEENLSIDLAKPRIGKCYDSFYEVHGTPDCPVIANSFTDLFRNLLDSEGETLFWLEPIFEELGFAEL